MIGHGPGQVVKMKSAIQIFPASWREPNGWASWLVSSNFGSRPYEESGRLDSAFTCVWRSQKRTAAVTTGIRTSVTFPAVPVFGRGGETAMEAVSVFIFSSGPEPREEEEGKQSTSGKGGAHR